MTITILGSGGSDLQLADVEGTFFADCVEKHRKWRTMNGTPL
jgi:hypothetical protein